MRVRLLLAHIFNSICLETNVKCVASKITAAKYNQFAFYSFVSRRAVNASFYVRLDFAILFDIMKKSRDLTVRSFQFLFKHLNYHL